MNKQKYSVVSEIYLEDVATNSSSFLYGKLIDKKVDVFPNNTKFIFYNFNEIPKTVLTHTVKTLNYIDIPSFFVTVITNQETTRNYFENLEDPIEVIFQNSEYFPVNDNTIVPEFNLDNHLCAHAWVGLWAQPDGSVAPCCDYSGRIKKEDSSEFNIRQDRFQDIISSPYMKDLRDQFRSKNVPEGCQNCIKRERVAGESRRSLALYKLKNIYGRIDWESEPKDIMYVGGHLGNICNLKCRICSPTYSSKIAQENITHNLDSTNSSLLSLKNNNWPAQKISFWDDLKDLLPTVRSFEMLGGEPFIIQENIDFVNYVVDQGFSSICEFDFSTNGTIFPSFLHKDIDFSRMSITLSIDNIGKKFELERHGASWTQVENNIKKYIQLSKENKKFKVGICVTVSILNVLYLPEILEWIKDINVSHYYFNLLHIPNYLSIEQMTDDAKKLVLNRIKSVPELDFIVNILNNCDVSDGKEFRKQMLIKDRIRSENFTKSHKDIALAMGFSI